MQVDLEARLDGLPPKMRALTFYRNKQFGSSDCLLTKVGGDKRTARKSLSTIGWMTCHRGQSNRCPRKMKGVMPGRGSCSSHMLLWSRDDESLHYCTACHYGKIKVVIMQKRRVAQTRRWKGTSSWHVIQLEWTTSCDMWEGCHQKMLACWVKRGLEDPPWPQPSLPVSGQSPQVVSLPEIFLGLRWIWDGIIRNFILAKSVRFCWPNLLVSQDSLLGQVV